MSAVNATVSGKLSKDYEEKYLPDGRKMVVLNIPVSKGKDKPTTWYQGVITGKRTENDKFLALLKKGAGVVVSGELEFKTFEKQDGTLGFSHTVYANSIDIVGYAETKEPEEEF